MQKPLFIFFIAALSSCKVVNEREFQQGRFYPVPVYGVHILKDQNGKRVAKSRILFRHFRIKIYRKHRGRVAIVSRGKYVSPKVWADKKRIGRYNLFQRAVVERYVGANRAGVWKTWHLNGQLASWVYYGKKKSFKDLDHWRRDEIIKEEYWDETGVELQPLFRMFPVLYYFTDGKKKLLIEEIPDTLIIDGASYSGQLVAKNSKNKTVHEWQWKDGLLDGIHLEYYPSGVRKEEIKYAKGLKNGTFQQWYENGVQKVSGGFKNGKRHGEFINRKENGEVVSQGSWAEGEKDGWHIEVGGKWEYLKEEYKNGKLLFSLKLTNQDSIIDYPDSIYFKFDRKDGSLSTIYDYKNKFSKTWKNGRLSYSKTWDKQNGDYTELCTTWMPDGGKEMEFSRLNGPRHGAYTRWYKSSQILEKGTYEAGKKQGMWETFYPNGNKAREAHYHLDTLHGTATNWFETGEKSHEMVYDKGAQIQYTEWSQDGDRTLIYSQDTTLQYCYVNMDSVFSLLVEDPMQRARVLADSAWKVSLSAKEELRKTRQQFRYGGNATDAKTKELKSRDSVLTAQLGIQQQLLVKCQKQIESYHINNFNFKKRTELIASIRALYKDKEGCDIIIDTSGKIMNNGPQGRTIIMEVVESLKKMEWLEKNQE